MLNLPRIKLVVQCAGIGYALQNQGGIVKNLNSIIGGACGVEKILNFYEHYGRNADTGKK